MMAVGNSVNNKVMRDRKSQIDRKKIPQRKRKQTQKVAAKSLPERVDHYNLLSSLVQANPGIKIGQLLRGDVKDAAVMERQIFRGTAGKKVMAAIDQNNGQKRSSDDGRWLKLVKVSVFVFMRKYCSTQVQPQMLCLQTYVHNCIFNVATLTDG